MTKVKKRQHGQGSKIMATIKTIETVILITITIYKAVKLVIEEIRTQCVSSQPSDPADGADQWHLK
jgi:hypothetical protein